MKKIEMIGNRYGKLVVISEIKERQEKNIYYICQCDCGNQKICNGYLLRIGKIKSCGCLQKEKPNSLKHGKSNKRPYYIWKDIKKD